jgi:hypothetical protein
LRDGEDADADWTEFGLHRATLWKMHPHSPRPARRVSGLRRERQSRFHEKNALQCGIVRLASRAPER